MQAYNFQDTKVTVLHGWLAALLFPEAASETRKLSSFQTIRLLKCSISSHFDSSQLHLSTVPNS